MSSAGCNPRFVLLAVFLAAATGYAVYRLFASLRRDRFAADTPLARIRSAAQGYVHLEGRAGPPPEGPMTAPLSGLPCVWWDYKIEQRQARAAGNQRNEWRIVDNATSVAPFLLRDADGECLVGPVGADVTPTSHETWYGDLPRPACLTGASGWSPEREYRYSERLICPDAHLTVLGELRSHSAIESIEQEVGKIVVGWKQDQATLLARFDRNHDGQLDAEEWEAARAAARQQVEASVGSQGARVSVVGQTTHGEPFLIAPLDGKNLIRREKHRAALALAASVVLAILTAWAAQKAILR
jgi:hypothetical protein